MKLFSHPSQSITIVISRQPWQKAPLLTMDQSERARTRTPHMKPAEPVTFIRFPYRPSVMTLLRQVKTTPTDSVASSYSNPDPPRVYASYQNNWNKTLDVPVLSIVGACNTNISPPIFRRDDFQFGTITVMATTPTEQHLVEFKLPLLQSQYDCIDRVVIQSADAFDLGDQMSSFIIHAFQGPIALIKLFNLTTQGCIKLHINSIHSPPRIEAKDEIHVLGLSGDRQTTFQIMFPCIHSPALSLFEELDLQAIGYR